MNLKDSVFNKILIIRPRFLGDLILATGMPEVIHQKYPEAQVWVLAETAYADALQNHPGIAGVIPFDASRKNNLFYLLKSLAEMRGHKFDVVLDLFGNPRTARMTYLSGAPVRVGYDLRGRSWAYTELAKPTSDPLPSGRRPVTEAYLDQLRALGFVTNGAYKTFLYVTDEEKAYVRKLFDRAGIKPGQKTVAIAPGASWQAKHWPLERFVELGHHLQSVGVRPLYIFGPKDADLSKEFEEKMNKDWLFINQPNLRGLIAFIQAADALVANDAGPMHVGPAVGTPTLGIFGPGEPEIWFPYGAPHEAAYHEVPCSHCGLETCPLMACMDHLETETIALKVMKLLKSKR